MKKRLPIVMALVVAVIAVVVWRWRTGTNNDSPSAAAAGSSRATVTSDKPRVVAATPRPDPKTLGRGSLAGTITVDDATKAPIAGAQVCAYGQSNSLATELLRQPTCVSTDAQGRYTLGNLLPAEYRVGANAKTFRPAVYHPNGDRKRDAVHLAAGDAKTGIDLALRTGGVEITGTVLDLTGGVVAHARVWSGERGDRILGSTESDEKGRFSMWVSPDYTTIHATADGYDDSEEWVDPPTQDVEVILTPESTIAGTVIDAASGQPVEGARVQLGDWSGSESSFSDAQGKFRLGKLSPSRYVIYARTDHAYGRTDGSTLVGLGQNVNDVVVKLFPAVRVTGKVIISMTKSPCLEPQVSLNDPKAERYVQFRRNSDGTVWAEGVLPGEYEPSIGCEGYQARDKYERITITNKDVTDLIWEVDAGATIRGRILARSGSPIEEANVWAHTIGSAARERTGWGGDESGRDGSYSLEGLRPGTYKLEVSSDKGAAPKDGYKIEVAAGAVIDKDLVLDDVGSIKGVVVDANGAPVTKVNASAYLVGGGRGWANHEVDDTGAFTLEGLRPGEYRVNAQRGWRDSLRKPGTTDDAKQGEKVVVRANQVATVRLVVEALAGKIRGTVVDTANQPVTDAFISAVRESDAAGANKSSVSESRWNWGEKPVLTSTDGTFVVEKLAPGNYTIRAYRRGGGEAVAEHVPVDGTTKLQIKPTGAIRGVAKLAPGDKASLAELELTLQDRKTGFWRDEGFYMSEGRFAIEDLPEGNFDLSAKVPGSTKTIQVSLAEGEVKQNVVIELEGSTTLKGRLVEYGTTKPVPGVRMMASPIIGSTGVSWGNDDEPNITDDAGGFVIERAPRGRIYVRGFPKDWTDSDYTPVSTVRTPGPDGDLGDIPIFKKRVKRGDAEGELGVNFADQPEDTLPDDRQLKVSWIDPAGPAAKVDLKAGDIVTTIDGIDIAGANYAIGWGLMRAPPGTKLALGLARGTSVTIVLAPP
ncbi:MAG: carboxypeptidase regulatory-like domain-containing protein [Kofleriaceae bacterium]